MNRSSNLLNGYLLGSSGRSPYVFIRSAQWCVVQTTVLLSAGRMLSTKCIAQASTAASLSAAVSIKGVLAVKSSFANTGVTLFRGIRMTALLTGTVGYLAKLRVLRFSLIGDIALNVVASFTTYLTIGKLLKGNIPVGIVTNAVLSEASRQRGPDIRNSYIPRSSRVSIV